MAPVVNDIYNRPPQVPIEKAIEEVKKALKSDPYAANLHLALLKLYGDAKNLEGMRAEFAIFKSLVPNDPLVKTLIEAGFK